MGCWWIYNIITKIGTTFGTKWNTYFKPIAHIHICTYVYIYIYTRTHICNYCVYEYKQCVYVYNCTYIYICGCITHHPPKSIPSRPPWHRQKAPREPTLRPGERALVQRLVMIKTKPRISRTNNGSFGGETCWYLVG